MSERWPGGIVRSTPVTPTGPLQNGTAPGMWTLDQANYWIAQGLWPTAGNFLAVEDVFSTWLYTGNGSTQTITNGIDLAGQGGLVWIKQRGGADNHQLRDTSRGGAWLASSSTIAAQPSSTTDGTITSYNSNGFTLGTSGGNQTPNGNGTSQVAWTFREAANFFDVVTYTGTGSARTIAHNLGIAPGCIIVKRTDTTSAWQVYHQSTAAGMGPNKYMVLNSTAAEATGSDRWNNTAPTSTVFSVGNAPETNASGGTYVAYLFAHDTSSSGIIQCGSYSGTGVAGQVATLGFEPQWVLIKSVIYSGDWFMFDTMRGMATLTDGTARLRANTSGAESILGGASSVFPTATGFGVGGGATGLNQSGENYIYIAIRRGPMRTPTVGTSVFAPVTWSGTGTNNRVITGAPTASDSILINTRNQAANYWNWNDRLRGAQNTLYPYTTNAENAGAGATYGVSSINMDGFTQGSQDGLSGGYNASGATAFAYFFKRAPSFFDEVCWTGNGVNPTSLNHNLGVAPELIITKKRNSTSNWITGYDFTSTTYKYFFLNETLAATSYTYASTPVYGGNPTSSVFIVGNQGNMNISGDTYVSYLFASCPGVSKVGSYTGTGTTQTINCGFTTGARFVLIKRTDSTGDWYVWDSARGIVAGNDPYLLLNSTAAEVTGTDYIDTDNSGFQISSTAPAAINANGGTFIYLAIS